MSRLLTTALLAILATGAYCGYRSRCRHQRNQGPAEPEPLQTWEEEGGGVPVSEGKTAAQVEPRTSIPPQPSSQPPIQGAMPSPAVTHAGLDRSPESVHIQPVHPVHFGG